MSRVTCYAGPDPTVECGADPCPTFLERVAESGMLEPDFENGTWDRWPPGTPDTGSFDQVWANEIWAFWCKTGDDRRFDKFTDVTRVTMHPMGVDGEFEEVWERGRIDVFDESGMLVGTSRFGQVCCDGEVADRAWWGEPNQATEPGCVGDHCCVEWFTYQQEELLQMAEAARRRTP
ncbi:MAG: hypothetical protein H6735_01350 [Alphaproteobacteria bacterium]|nr:hypothetical protein [Alphaproteobacteria bacterium]